MTLTDHFRQWWSFGKVPHVAPAIHSQAQRLWRSCAEPFGDEVQSIVKRLLADSENDKSLAFKNFTDPCPELSKKRLQTLKWFDYADKKKLPSSALADRLLDTWFFQNPTHQVVILIILQLQLGVWRGRREQACLHSRGFQCAAGQEGPECDHEHAAH